MALTLSSQLSAFPSTAPPVWPQCGPFFARPVSPQLNDCLIAFNRLPINEDPITYRPLRRDPTQPRGLLVMETHNTCQPKFHASGKWVEEHDFSIDISPNKIRDMFGGLMDECVQRENSGGSVTNGVRKTIDWILREDTEFPGEPGRTPAGPRNVYIPESATFLTAMIWNTNNGDIEQFEPGANHPVLAILLYRAIDEKSFELDKEDPESAFAEELIHRANFLSDLYIHRQLSLRRPWWTWWGTERRRLGGSNSVSGSGSLALLNSTGLQMNNVTAPGLERVGDEDCTATRGEPAGSCSVSSRSKRR